LFLDLKHFTDKQDENFREQMVIGHLVWRELRSLRVYGTTDTIKTIMRHCDPDVLSALHLDTWIDSDILKKARGLKKLSRVHLYYDRPDLAEPATWACFNKGIWDEIKKLCWVRLASSVFLEYLILREASVDIQGQLDGWEDLGNLRKTIEDVEDGARTSFIRHLAFSLNYKRFSPRLIRLSLGVKNPRRRQLQDSEVDEWYTMIVKGVMKPKRLREAWIFASDSLAYKGSRDSTETVSVERQELEPDPGQTSFPWGLLDD
ncbi:hypothetical protein IL306_013580, partial [Fusarium sp. DS 682]